jgi:Icc-related predicted phosphoesterase
MTMIGLPFVTELPNWAFNKYEFYIDNYLEALPQVDIVVSHSPPYGILDGVHHDRWAHYGVHAYNRFLREKPPKLWICGHCHDCYGHDRWKGVDFYNVAHCDEYYNQTNKPLVLEL